jgi:replicative DNA helicase
VASLTRTGAERSLLGAILLRNEVFHEVEPLVDEQDFGQEAHRLLFRAMAALMARGAPVDLITLREELEAAGGLSRVGGAGYLARLVDGVARSALAHNYAVMVRAYARQRCH